MEMPVLEVHCPFLMLVVHTLSQPFTLTVRAAVLPSQSCFFQAPCCSSSPVRPNVAFALLFCPSLSLLFAVFGVHNFERQAGLRVGSYLRCVFTFSWNVTLWLAFHAVWLSYIICPSLYTSIPFSNDAFVLTFSLKESTSASLSAFGQCSQDESVHVPDSCHMPT